MGMTIISFHNDYEYSIGYGCICLSPTYDKIRNLYFNRATPSVFILVISKLKAGFYGLYSYNKSFMVILWSI